MTLRVPCLLALVALLGCGDKESPGDEDDGAGNDTADDGGEA